MLSAERVLRLCTCDENVCSSVYKILGSQNLRTNIKIMSQLRESSEIINASQYLQVLQLILRAYLGIAYDGTIADVWSLGVVLYTMVSASLPFDDSNLKTLLEQVMRAVHFSSRKKISKEVKDLICTMLQPNVDKRATITEVREHSWFKGEKFAHANQEEATEQLKK